MISQTKIAIVGASLAGVAAADAARSAGYDGAIHLYDSQPDMPYDRPPLSKGILTGAQGLETIALKSEQQWKEHDVDLRLGCPVLSVDPNRTVTTAVGSAIYDGVILAPGTQARQVPFPVSADVRAHVLRTTEDALSLRAAVTDAASVVIIGGGFIGLEVASAVTALGKRCTVVETAEMPLASAVGTAISQFVVDRHRAAGCDFRTGIQVQRIDQSPEHRAAIHLSDGSVLRADLVVLSIGVEPAIRFLAGSGVELDNGIRTDEFCQTNIERIYACGDAANGYSRLYQRHVRIAHWTTAREQGTDAAANLVADLVGRDRSPSVHVPYVWSDQLDMKIQIVGRLLEGATVDVERCDASSLSVAFRLDGVLVGGAAINHVRDVMRLRRTLASTLAEAMSRVSP